MRSSLFSISAVAMSLGVAACSAANPLNGIGGQPPDAAAPAAPVGDPGSGGDGNGTGGGTGGGSAPSPRFDAGVPASEDAGPPFGGDAGAIAVGDGASPISTPDAGAGGTIALLAHCVSTLSSYRTQAGVSVLTESSSLEAYAMLASASDAQSGQTHGYYAGNDGSGVSSAESELPGWPLNQYASVSDLVDQGIAAIFNQGPGAAPYDNLVNASFTQAGCGIAQTPDGNVWVAFEYK